MGTIISTVLIAAPIAFIAGWILAKAVFRYHGSAAQDNDYRQLLHDQQVAVRERDGQVAELHAELDAANARLLQQKQKFRTWRERIKPIARQFRQQRTIINELRDELRRRDTSKDNQVQKPAAAATTRKKTAEPVD